MNKNFSNEFPINNKLIYLNNASYAPISKSVIQKLSSFLLNEYSTLGPDSKYCDLKKKVDDTRLSVAQFINCDPDEVVFTQSITHGINIIAEGLSFNKSDTILLREASKDHVANFLPWLKRAKTDHLRIEILGADIDGGIDINLIEEHVTKNKGGLITLPHAPYNYGTLLDVSKISSLAHKYGYSVFIDAGQTVGCRSIDVKKMGCDFLAFSGYKWLCSTPGIGVLYIKKDVQDRINYYGLDVRSLASRKDGERIILDFSDNEYSVIEGPQRFEAGFRNYTGIVALQESLKFLNKIGIKNIQNKNESLLKLAINELSKLPKIKIYGPNSVKKRTSLISFSFSDNYLSGLVSYLSDNGTVLAAREIGSQGIVRISPHFYNTNDQIIKTVSQIKQFVKKHER